MNGFSYRDSSRSFEKLLDLEWLETNGLGGWASSTVSGAHSRRYHGVLVAATNPPVERTVLLSKLDETLEVEGERWDLGANCFHGVVHPRGFENLIAFERDLFPVFTYEAGGVRLRKTVAAVHGENTTLVIYEVLSAPRRFTLDVRPLVAARGSHDLGSADRPMDLGFHDGVLCVSAQSPIPPLFLLIPGSRLEQHTDWWYRFEYGLERSRGFECHEDLWTPGVLRSELGPGDRLGVVVSTVDPRGRDAETMLAQERRRRESRLELPAEAPQWIRPLALAADQFVVRRDPDLRTIIAGYPWFGDWGRDTMIALPGLTLVTGRHQDARAILRAFAGRVSDGMLPNRFPDSGEAPEYNTVDATLWFFVAIHEYFAHSEDEAFVQGLLPTLRDIVAWHDRGSRFGIRVDADGLVQAGQPGVQLTWMDAKVGDWVVTPRIGKPVEVNALWYNALAILASLEKRLGQSAAGAALERRAERVRRQFGKLFWYEDGGYLYDVVNDEGSDPALRPNQIFAMSLPFPLLSIRKGRRMLRVVEKALLTPFGLRSLAPNDADYHPTYEGDAVARDGAYHQGTVWSWLLGPFITALVRLRGEPGRVRARDLLERASEHLAETCVGSVSEIFDAEPPHAPRGAVAQAWSVAEWLRVSLEEVSGHTRGAP